MKITQNTPVAAFEKSPRQWGFNKLKVGGSADIFDKSQWADAAQAAYSYAYFKGWKVTAHWNKEKSFGRIRRIK